MPSVRYILLAVCSVMTEPALTAWAKLGASSAVLCSVSADASCIKNAIFDIVHIVLAIEIILFIDFTLPAIPSIRPIVLLASSNAVEFNSFTRLRYKVILNAMSSFSGAGAFNPCR